jgi:conjugal transfer/entry exclusion protein
MAANPVGAIVMAVMLLITALIALIAIMVIFIANYESGAEKAAKKVNQLSAEIYELDQRAQSIRNITEEFDALDNKILKTSEDLAQMETLLDQAAESLDNEEVDDKEDTGYGEGISQREAYDALETQEAKREFLEQAANDAEAQADQKRQEQLDTINNLSAADKKNFMTSKSADMVKARDAIYAINNNRVYKQIDAMTESGAVTEEAAAATEALTQSLLSQVDAYTALEYANNPKKVEDLTKALAEANIVLDDFNYSVAEVLTSDDFNLKDKIMAFDEATAAVAGNADALKALQTTYNEFAVFKKMGDDVIDFIDEMNLSYDQINNLHGMMGELNKELKDEGFYINPASFDATFETLMQSMASNGADIGQTINDTFGSYLSGMEYMGED